MTGKSENRGNDILVVHTPGSSDSPRKDEEIDGGVKSMRKTVATPGAPAAIGPYSQAVWAGDLLFVSGQICMDPKTGELVGKTAAEQAEQVLKNLGAILESQGLSFAKVVKATVFAKDMNDFQAVNEVYAKFFAVDPPARVFIEVARLPKDVLVEVDAIAVKG